MRCVFRSVFSAVLGVVIVALTSCGGSSSPSLTPYQPGIYLGGGSADTLSGLEASFLITVLLDDKTYWYFYHSPISSTVNDMHYGQGTYDSSTGKFTASIDYAYVLTAFTSGSGIVSTGSLDGTISNEFSGSLTNSTIGGSLFRTTFVMGSTSPPSLSTIAGKYSAQMAISLSDLGCGIQLDLTVSPAGAVTGTGTTTGGCSPITYTIAGSFLPDSDVDVYDGTLTFTTSSASIFSNVTFTSVIYYEASTRTLYLGAVSNDRSNGFGYSATGPN